MGIVIYQGWKYLLIMNILSPAINISKAKFSLIILYAIMNSVTNYATSYKLSCYFSNAFTKFANFWVSFLLLLSRIVGSAFFLSFGAAL